jgi:membrane-bound serine protease (ClpP class)
MLGARAEVTDWSGTVGHVFLLGERWKAVSTQPLQAGQRVRVVAIDGLTLAVAPEETQPGGTTA